MHMVTVRTDLEKRDFVAGGDLQADLSEDCVYIAIENNAPILRGSNRVIEQCRNVVALVNIGAHASQ